MVNQTQIGPLYPRLCEGGKEPHCPCARLRPISRHAGACAVCGPVLPLSLLGDGGGKVDGIEAFPAEVEVKSGWSDLLVVMIKPIWPVADLGFLLIPKDGFASTSVESED